MRSFEQLKKEHTLIPYLGSEYGTMYFEPDVPQDKETIIGHLDGILPVELLSNYEQLYNSIIDLVETNAVMNKYAVLPQLIEVGKDFIIRPFFVYDIALRDYMDEEDEEFYVEPPALFEKMKAAVAIELNHETGNIGIVKRVLVKSLLEATGKTIYDNNSNKFIIIEPKISVRDLKDWSRVTP